jgi:hypothetical protein
MKKNIEVETKRERKNTQKTERQRQKQFLQFLAQTHLR